MVQRYSSVTDLPASAPVFPLAGVLLLPHTRLPLNIFEPRYLDMIDDALASPHRLITMIQPRDPDADLGDDAPPAPLHTVGSAGRIVSFMETEDGRYLINLEGIARCHVSELPQRHAYREARLDFTPYAPDLGADAAEADMDREGLERVVRDFAERHSLSLDWDAIEKTPNEPLVNSLSMMAPYGPREKQALLEAQTVVERADMLIALTEMWLAGADDQGPESPLQ